MDDKDVKDRLLDAALMHVPFDGWSPAAFDAAATDSGVDPALARAICPRGAVDLALAYHQRGDDEMIRRIHTEDLSAMRFRDRVAAAVRFRIEAADDKEVVRRGSALFALPHNAADGARAIWGTADKIWTALGDRSDDVNWYTKRTILSGVYSSTVLYWLGDESDGHQATWEFLDRRIDGVMQFEKVKARLRDNRAFNTVFAGPLALIGKIRAPMRPTDDLPGRWPGPQ
ncbi:COQ9 family protein [Lacimonas salitolerans]|uniref:COQ9 family protein n=1 Tax=Lacimonas salitolerans TaxID=1323750 RepID=A0ABW4EJI2_9RHOB